MWRGFWLAEDIFSHMRFDFSHGYSSAKALCLRGAALLSAGASMAQSAATAASTAESQVVMEPQGTSGNLFP